MVHWTLTKIDRRYVRMTSDDHAKTNKIFGLAIHQKRSTSTLFLLMYKMMLSAVSRSHLVTYFVWPRRHRPTVRMILSKHMYICNYVDGKKIKRPRQEKKRSESEMEELTKSSCVDQLDILSMDCSWYGSSKPRGAGYPFVSN